MIGALALLPAAVIGPLYAMEAAGQVASRAKIIDMSIAGAAKGEQAAELAPIRVRSQQVFGGDELLLAKTLHLYNQRRLTDAKDNLKEILIDDPKNNTALTYLKNITSKIEARNLPREVLEEGVKGIASVERAQSGKIYGKEEFGDTNGEDKFTTNSVAIAAKTNQQGEDLSSKFMAEAMKLEGSIGDYKYTATANVNYYNNDNKEENKRLRNATWWMKNEKVQFIMGDTSSLLSRYILNGVNYRGVNFKMDLFQSTFGDVRDNITVLYGKVPFFLRTEDEYIYPREITGIRNEMTLWNWWTFNTTFAYLVDNDTRVTKIDPNDKAKQNGLVGFDQVIRILPNIWTLYQETAFSYDNEDTSADNKILRSSANYFVSDIKTKNLKVYNSYERIEPNFHSYVGLSGFSANNEVTIDREHILNFLEYMPYDEVDLGLQHSKSRTNLNKRYDRDTIETNNYKANLKIMPKNGLPRFSLRGSVWTSSSEPSALESPAQESNWDGFFEMAKPMWGTDLSISYGQRGYSQFLIDTNTYGYAFAHVFTLSANRKFFDRIEVTPSYSLERAHLIKRPDRDVYTDTVTNHLFDLNLSSGLWDTANLTFDYNFSRTGDFATSSMVGTNNAFTTTFSWPFTTTLGFRKKLVFSPFLSYHYSTGTATYLDRTYWAGRLEGDYFLTENTKLNLSGEYRDNIVSDPTYLGFGDEYRIILSYKTVNGF